MPAESVQNDNMISQHIITKLLHVSEDTSNPVYKLIMGNLQLVLINVLIGSILEHKHFTR